MLCIILATRKKSSQQARTVPALAHARKDSRKSNKAGTKPHKLFLSHNKNNHTPDGRATVIYFDRMRIFLRFFCKRRTRFFFHFQRILACAFFQGLDLCAMAAVQVPTRVYLVKGPREKELGLLRCAYMEESRGKKQHGCPRVCWASFTGGVWNVYLLYMGTIAQCSRFHWLLSNVCEPPGVGGTPHAVKRAI